jgi:HEPN domain-containing protein
MKKPTDTVRDWLTFAADDLHAAEVLMDEDIPNQVCFHSQQCIEKTLKALLLHNGQPCPKVHDLNELYARCKDANILVVLPFKNEIAMLGLFYLPTRYPDALVGSLPDRLPTDKDAKLALETAEKVHAQLIKGLTP